MYTQYGRRHHGPVLSESSSSITTHHYVTVYKKAETYQPGNTHWSRIHLVVDFFFFLFSPSRYRIEALDNTET